MKRLLICDTLYQIIVCIQLCNTLFKEDTVDFWISDHTTGSEEIVKRLRNEDIAHKVSYIQTKSIIYADGIIKKLIATLRYGLGNESVEYIDTYDEIAYYSGSSIIYGLLSICEKKKINVSWARFEEGIFSYETDHSISKGVKLLDIMRRIQGKETLTEKVSKYYCFFPQLKDRKAGIDVIKIPSIETNIELIRGQLSRVFNFQEIEIPQKYIFFASSSDIDGHPFGETEAIVKVAETVGKGDIIVKIHPRDTRLVFNELGIETLQATGVPWEVFQICSDLKDKCLVTVTSGAFINCAALLNKLGSKCFFIYPCINSQEESFRAKISELDEYLSRMDDAGLLTNVYKAKTLDDLCGAV